MKKIFHSYALIWAVLFVLFQIISFVSPGWIGYEKYTVSFWIGYVFIFLSFIGQLMCSYFALQECNAQKTFYNLSLISTSFSGLIISFLVGGITMLFSPLPYWIGTILCAIVFALNAIAVAKASAAIPLVNDMDTKLQAQTSFIRSLTVDAESLMSRAKSEGIKAECKKVYEAVRYSDPMSSAALASVESEIAIKFSSLSAAVASNNFDAVAECANELVIMISERNKKCKLLK